MDSYTMQEAAERGGVSVEQLAQLVDLQVLGQRKGDKFTTGDIRKIGLLRDLLEGGLPLEALAAEIKIGRLSLDFMDNPTFELFSGLTGQTFEDLSVATGIPVQTLMVIREAIGAAIPKPGDRLLESELSILPFIEAQLASGYSLAAIERGLRTMGDSLRRLSIAEADAFVRFVIAPLAQRPGVKGAEISAAAVVATERIAPATDRALLAVYRAQQSHAWTTNIFEGFERDLAAAGLYWLNNRPPAVCFLDITGYTRVTGERGDEAASELAHDLARLVQRTSVQHGGRPVKWLGDGVMLYFREPGSGVLAALAMAEGVLSAGLPPAHVGLHAGPVVMKDGDYYGQTVNIASRIAQYARQGEVVVSQAVVDSAEGAPVTFTDLGDVEMKGVAGTVHLYAAHRIDRAATPDSSPR